jgi:hypothetical protein
MAHLADKVDMLSRTFVQPDQAPLTREEGQIAYSQLERKYPAVVRSVNDPEILGQRVGLFSFTPSRGAKPDQYGVYGVLKLRGNFAHEEEASTKAEELVRRTDSYNPIYHTFVGQTVPLAVDSSKFTDDIQNVDLKKHVDDIVSQQTKSKLKQEKEEMKSIQERERELLKENEAILQGTYEEDTLDNYIMTRVKKAQLVWTYLENKKKLDQEVKTAILKVRDELAVLDEKHPEYIKEYFERYKEARESVGISEGDKFGQSNFMNYLMEDGELDF